MLILILTILLDRFLEIPNEIVFVFSVPAPLMNKLIRRKTTEVKTREKRAKSTMSVNHLTQSTQSISQSSLNRAYTVQ